MKQICAVSLTLALAVVASGCNTDDLSDAGHTFPDKPAEKMTIHATTGQQSGTRVAYEDGAAGMNGKLTWQKGDRLTVMRMNGSDYVAHADDYEYGGTDGATSGPFTGTAITGAGNSWTIYYPHTVAVNTYYATVTLPMTGQTQTADGNTDHLRNYLLLSSTGIKDLDAGFDLEMQNSIMKFEFSNVPAEVGELTRLVWAAETETDSRIPCTHYLMLNFAPGAVTFDADKHTLTAYLAFMPEEMKVKTGGKFTVMLMGDKTYLAETTIDGGKTYAAGMRYTAVVDGTSMKWEEKAVMIFTVRPVGDQFNIPFPESGTTPAELTVDWGDGTTPTTVASGTALSSKDAFCHSYPLTYVNYNIIITSGQTDKTLQQIPPFGYDRRGSRGKLISIDTPLLNTAETDFGSCFNGYISLQSIPEDLFANNPQATNFSCCFYSCTSLRSIPGGLFAHNPQATDFSYCFYETRLQSIPEDLFANNPQATDFRDCFNKTLLQSVPEGLFANNPQATNFRDCFSGTSLQSVPEGLFANNLQATDFWGCFYKTPLQSVPEGLFAHNPQATNFSYCLYKTSLQSVPEGLFANNTQAMNFSYCFSGTPLQSVPESLFANNTQVTNFSYCFFGTPLQSVPESLFANNTQVTNFKECFKDCTSLESVPTGLFANSPQVKDFTYCFEGCTALQSVPEGLFTNNTQVTNFKECFKDCTSLESVPTGLFANSPQVTDFSGCFEGCTALQSLPSGLFASTAATDFYSCFHGCTSLRSIPADLLAKLPAVTSLSGCFSGCTALRSIPAGLFDKNTRITSFRRCFADCTALNSIPNKLFDNNTSVTDFTGCFEGSSMAVIPKGVFDNNKWVESFENCFKDCLPLRAVPTGLFDKNTRATNFRRCFSGCLYLGMNEAIFSATKDYKQRFPNTNKKMDFRECFKGAGSAYVLPDMMAFTGSAPDLWNYDFGRAGYSSTDCFANVSFYLNNYSIIPSAWGGVKE